MLNHTLVTKTFPTANIAPAAGGLPVEISLVAQLGHGAGDHLFHSIVSRQKFHAEFVDELDEPSAKLAATDFSKGDATALYSFVVGPNGHPFHKHAGHRIFTAVSGSGGAQLRFSTATDAEIRDNPAAFIRALRYINIPADSLFTVRFGGETWHQFQPLARNGQHPAFFALSCHTNELGGDLSEDLKAKVIANQADIPSLTDVLPEAVQALLSTLDEASIPTTTLALDAAAGTFHRVVCDNVRSSAGLMRSCWTKLMPKSGFASHAIARAVAKQKIIPADSLLQQHLHTMRSDHDDSFTITLARGVFSTSSASALLALILDGFIYNSPKNVGRLMRFRNMLVSPLALRTSPLGCPVSSLLCGGSENKFANYPVLDQLVNAGDTKAEVILGADDKHLTFRSCIGVEITDTKVTISLHNRVHCLNGFGRFYMAVIEPVHFHYIGPTMLRYAVDHAVRNQA